MFSNVYEYVKTKSDNVINKFITRRQYVEDGKRLAKILILERKIASSRFHEAMKFSIKLAQWLSFFPIDIDVDTDRELKFRWLHWRVVYAMVTFILFVFEFLLHVHHYISSSSRQSTTEYTVVIVFNLGAIVQYMLFFKFTVELPKFIKEWKRVEDRMKHYEIFCNLSSSIKYITSSIMFLATVEHVLVNTHKLLKCLRKNPIMYEAFKDYFLKSYSHVFTFMEYSVWKGILAQFLNLQRTFNWTYADVFVMLISTAFKFRLKQMTKRIKAISRIQVVDINKFSSIRKDYEKLSKLYDAINNRISLIVIVCFTSNMFFIVFQLFNSLKRIEDITEKVYFHTSFALIVLRTTCLCILGGEIYEEWRNIATFLFSIRSAAYNEEVERFINQVITHRLVLSGKNLFYVTRNLILHIAGATVTYELALIQFNSDDLKQINY